MENETRVVSITGPNGQKLSDELSGFPVVNERERADPLAAASSQTPGLEVMSLEK